MKSNELFQRALAEFLGTAGLLVVIVGSGIMGEKLAQGNVALALLANSLATGAGLFALIQTFGPVSGAHFNPAVSFVEWLWRKISARELAIYCWAQVSGAILGVWMAHIMFGLSILQLSARDRGGFPLLVSELLATCGLITVISLSGKKNVETTPFAVALYITSAYWCTSSTSFANPAVSIARSLTDTFSGILWMGTPGFILAQVVGAVLGFYISGLFGIQKVFGKDIQS
jgi:glycerol uptake facilitator-like aquaporin